MKALCGREEKKRVGPGPHWGHKYHDGTRGSKLEAKGVWGAGRYSLDACHTVCM